MKSGSRKIHINEKEQCHVTHKPFFPIENQINFYTWKRYTYYSTLKFPYFTELAPNQCTYLCDRKKTVLQRIVYKKFSPDQLVSQLFRFIHPKSTRFKFVSFLGFRSTSSAKSAIIESDQSYSRHTGSCRTRFEHRRCTGHYQQCRHYYPFGSRCSFRHLAARCDFGQPAWHTGTTAFSQTNQTSTNVSVRFDGLFKLQSGHCQRGILSAAIRSKCDDKVGRNGRKWRR